MVLVSSLTATKTNWRETFNQEHKEKCWSSFKPLKSFNIDSSAEWKSRIWLIYWWKWNGWERGFLWNAKHEIIDFLNSINSKSKVAGGGGRAQFDYSNSCLHCDRKKKNLLVRKIENTPVKSGGCAFNARLQPLSCWSDTAFHAAGTFRFPAPPWNPTVCSQGNVWKWIMEISDGKLGVLVFHLACSYPEALLQPTRDRAGNITLSGREAHRGASPSQGTGQSIYLPVAWACLIQALT